MTRGQFIFAVVVLAAVIILPRLLFDRAAVGPHDDPAVAEFFESVTPYLDPEQPTTSIVDFERLFAAVGDVPISVEKGEAGIVGL